MVVCVSSSPQLIRMSDLNVWHGTKNTDVVIRRHNRNENEVFFANTPFSIRSCHFFLSQEGFHFMDVTSNTFRNTNRQEIPFADMK